MRKNINGRLDRTHFWMLVVLVIVTKLALNAYAPTSTANTVGQGIDIIMLGFLIARFHDFGAPAWVSISAWLALSIIWPIVFSIQHGNLANLAKGTGDPTLLLMATGPGMLLLLFAGTVSGEPGTNKFGPPDQGFSGGIRASESHDSGANSAAARRLKSVRGR